LTFICDTETSSLLQDKASKHFQAFFDVTMNSVKYMALWGGNTEIKQPILNIKAAINVQVTVHHDKFL
jgi:hypothetical protein